MINISRTRSVSFVDHIWNEYIQAMDFSLSYTTPSCEESSSFTVFIDISDAGILL